MDAPPPAPRVPPRRLPAPHPEDAIEPGRRSWERRTELPLLGLAVLFGAVYAVPIVAPGAPAAVHRVCRITEWLIWGTFAADYLVRLVLSRRRWRFVRRHPLDLAAVVLPLLRQVRLLRLVSTLLLAGERARMASRVQLTVYVAGCCAGLVMFGSLAVLEVERDSPNSNIHSPGDAVWWAFTTMTTVGYGDHAPTTGIGRLLAIALMLSGIALLGVVTANIAAWFISRFDESDEDSRRRDAALEALTHEVRALRAELAAQRRIAPANGAGAPGAGAGTSAPAGDPVTGAEGPEGGARPGAPAGTG
ncbi:potassium channel family protein [Streptomyces calidiresistens]|uniref:Two pore domain potassium channel family protein n=1 Tax=Streptomyces calidiresistens TaxID=1485586 RepID=A0A7W3T180_9ACTN|nr:potassium channel family protein [Streptomyces calidiresistens]MBB0228746.1 two pore domain potassium channel family protein [Streptomyces calidiresistens]